MTTAEAIDMLKKVQKALEKYAEEEGLQLNENVSLALRRALEIMYHAMEANDA